MKDQSEMERIVKQRLDEIRSVPPRNPKTASRARAQFLSEAVSVYELQRQKGWKSIFRKERYAMNAILSILVVAGLLFGGGATVRAAQDDLPNEPLYAVKMWTEDLSLRFMDNGEDKVNRLMELSQIRIQEMDQLVKAGEPIPDQVRLRLEDHIRQALQICVNLDDPTLERALLQIRDRLQQQDRDMAQQQLHTQEQLQLQTQEQLQQQTQTRTMLHERLQMVEEGLHNRELFREQVQNNFQYGQNDEVTPPVQNQNQEQNGEPKTDPGGPNTDPGGPNLEPGGPNTDPGGPNSDTGSNTNNTNNPDNDSGGNGRGGSGNGTDTNGSGGNGK